MTEVVGDWLHFTGRQPKRKRAELVCVFCHSKKIKCDLQSRKAQGHEKCSNCDSPDRECRLRPSNRGKRRHSSTTYDGRRDAPVKPTSPISSTCLREKNGVLPSPDITVVDVVEPPVPLRTQTMSSPNNVSVAGSVHSAPVQSLSEISHSHLPHAPPSGTSPGEGQGRSHLGDVDTGFLQVYGPENNLYADQTELEATLEAKRRFSHPQQQELLQSFAETYWEYCYAWCPVLDRDTLTDDLSRSPLLANALALAASHIQPPLMPHEGPATYYKRARNIFYDDEEVDSLMMLKALALFYWWAPRPPSTVHRDASWWWTSVIIRHAQQMNVHREPGVNHPLRGKLNISLRRRIWWTAFARERLTALCQSKPCIIDPDDCNIEEPQPSDFPSDPVSQHKGKIFIYWVRLCAIIGKIAKVLSRTSHMAPHSFPVHLHQELVDWIHSLPPELQLPIGSARTASFDRDVHQLHLPYLTTIIILHLKRSADDLPQALPPAILAASCIARILRDILSRGNVRFLMAITCWYSGTAFIPLLQACKIEQFAREAEEGLDVLAHAMNQLKPMWASAQVISTGFERLRKLRPDTANGMSNGSPPVPNGTSMPSSAMGHGLHVGLDSEVLTMPDHVGEFDWTLLFPFVSRSTNRIAECLLADKEEGNASRGLPLPEDNLFHETLMNQYQDLLDFTAEYPLDFSDMTFSI
ncbi:hypothetical protein jhhlp_004883 [Lomentospora prolificans]|uniref:Zn(2)-C6 fungal-type domain-containing protein n=1 Tax=Lomentospora prolificans TaxID=41688 RepID=A0A2N3N7S4_9PEZI|nr:hypothetical protein jhhlp_004883 [Lomentospora prolificans]